MNLDFFKRFLIKNGAKNKKAGSFHSDDERTLVNEFQKRVEIDFDDTSLILTALKHRSYLNVTNEERIASNERLEFLGDAVLDLVVTHRLYKKFSKRTEGQLSKIKSILVSKPVLAEIANNLSLGDLLLINKGEEKSGGRHRHSILADCMEAVIGAIYLDKGLEKADDFINRNLFSNFKSIMQRELYQNYKSMLLEYAQSHLGKLPEYRVLKEIGPDHDKNFVIAVYLNGKEAGKGNGKSKKIAEQRAAQIAIQKLGLNKEINKS